MSTYKVIQDIEAEDKLVGPLTLRQFIYAGVAAVCLYLCFVAYTKHVVFLIAFFLPIAAVTTFFAFPWKGEQPTEIWALARLRFMLKPRVRVWDQSNVKQLVTILAPRKLESPRPRTNNLSEIEVRSRLHALADTIDSRGWATRNASIGYQQVIPQIQALAPGQAILSNLNTDNDMFDDRSSVAQNFDAMLAKSQQSQRERVIQQIANVQATPSQPINMAPPMPAQYMPGVTMSPELPAPVAPMLAPPTFEPPMPNLASAAPTTMVAPSMPAPSATPAPTTSTPPSDYWFANGPTYPDKTNASNGSSKIAPPVIPESYKDAVASGRIMTDVPVPDAALPNQDENAFGQLIKQQKADEATQKINYSHMKVVQPLSSDSGAPAPAVAPSVPGMIDYGRPQPVDDQMLYDTSMPQGDNSDGSDSAGHTTTHPANPAILKAVNQLANNDDLDVATIARQVNREAKQTPDEVEIRLH